MTTVLLSTIAGILIGIIIGRRSMRSLYVETMLQRTCEALSDYEELLDDGEERNWNKRAFNILNDWVYYT